MLKITEIFHSIQGESTYAGVACVFVRLTGCNLRCTWCDTEYAFHDGRSMSIDEVLERVARYPARVVEVTGGEPLLQPEAVPLMERLLAAGYRVLLETSGAAPIEDVPEGVVRIVDVKCPGSGEAERNRWSNLDHLRTGDQLKFVIRDRDDYVWATDRLRELGLLGLVDRGVEILFSPVHDLLEPGTLAEWMLRDGLPVRLQVQLHKILWPGVLRGV